MPGIVEKAIARESTICLPTYAVRSENRNTVFRSQYGVVHIGAGVRKVGSFPGGYVRLALRLRRTPSPRHRPI